MCWHTNRPASLFRASQHGVLTLMLSPTAPLRTTWLGSFGFWHLATWLDHLRRNPLTPLLSVRHAVFSGSFRTSGAVGKRGGSNGSGFETYSVEGGEVGENSRHSQGQPNSERTLSREAEGGIENTGERSASRIHRTEDQPWREH